MVSIVVRNLSKRFGNTVALDRVSLTIDAGELFFLLGPSGCGKTTLLRHIAGFYTPDAGHIFFDMQEVTHVPPHRRNTAMMFQSYALWPHMTVARNVAFGLEERRMDPEDIEENVTAALANVRMSEFANRKINELSGGQQQRVALARALVVRPQCLLLDEPLSNLDAKLRHEMRDEIRRIVKEFGLTAVYVTHDQKEALSMADRMAVMHDGRIAQIGTPRDIYLNPRSATVADFIGETNFVPGTMEGDTSREHLWSVATTHGRFWGRLADPVWKPRRGEPVVISIRPECIELSESRELRNSIHGRVTQTIYLGELAQYQFTADDGTVIRISELNPHRLPEPDHGPAFAYTDPEEVVILRDDSPRAPGSRPLSLPPEEEDETDAAGEEHDGGMEFDDTRERAS